MSDKTRSIEQIIDIDAPIEDVWRALSDAQELMRWFPLNAEVEPGAGGVINLAWGDSFKWDMNIDLWNPPTRLRTLQTRVGPYDVAGKIVETAKPISIALEYNLETVGGKTRLRLVHSGFGTDQAWDDEYDGTVKGWGFELRGLRHYLEHHRGRNRRAIWVRALTDLPASEAWTRLTRADAMGVEGDPGSLREGDRYSLSVVTGDRFIGRVLQAIPPSELSGTVESANNGLMRIGVERAMNRTSPQVWLSTWDVDSAWMDAFEKRVAALLAKIFSSQIVTV
jgi:uncharacterized protein YndB with AHSA1/START domain